MKYFEYDNDNGQVLLKEESLLLISEYKALLAPARNKTKTDKTGKNKEKAFKEFVYIYLFLD